jgi:hypothetical protein
MKIGLDAYRFSDCRLQMRLADTESKTGRELQFRNT